MRYHNAAVGLALALAAAVARAGAANQDSPHELAAALKLIPPDAVAFAAIPDLQRANAEVAGLVAAMDLPESVLAGKPIDQLKALLGVAAQFDDAGAVVVWMQMREGIPVGVLAIPADDSAAFISANLLPFVSEDGTAAPEGALGFHGTPVFARAAAKHALVSTDRSLVDSYAPGDGLAANLVQRIGAAGMKALERGEFCAWSDGAALAQIRGAQGPDGARTGLGLGLNRSPRALTLSASVQAPDASAPAPTPWASDVVLAIDVEPLGVCARTFIKPVEGSALSKLATPAPGAAGASFSELPAQRAYFALAFNLPASGSIAAAIPEGVPLPPAVLAWITGAGELVAQVQLAAYPSKLGILAGGFLNDSAMVLMSPKPPELRDFIRDQLQALPPESDGVRRSVKWEDERKLKDGTTVAAFEVKETALGTTGGAGQPAQLVAAQAMMRQALTGPRGLHGFVRCTSDAVIVTFSQRQDVLERATAAAAGGKALEGEEIVRAIRPWLLEQPHFIALLWSGQVARAIEQVAGSFGAGGMISLPVDLDPIGFAARADGGCIDTVIMVPTSVMVAGYEQMKNGAMTAEAVEEPVPVDEPSAP